MLVSWFDEAGYSLATSSSWSSSFVFAFPIRVGHLATTVVPKLGADWRPEEVHWRERGEVAWTGISRASSRYSGPTLYSFIARVSTIINTKSPCLYASSTLENPSLANRQASCCQIWNQAPQMEPFESSPIQMLLLHVAQGLRRGLALWVVAPCRT